MDQNGDIDDNVIDKILRTLTAIANISKDSVGYVIIGVADNKRDSDFHDKHYKSTSIKCKNFYVTGVQEEVKKYGGHEKFRNMIEAKIKNSSISPSSYKDQILRNIDYFNFYDKSLLILKIQTEDAPAKFGNNYYERQGTSTVMIDPDKEVHLWKRMIK